MPTLTLPELLTPEQVGARIGVAVQTLAKKRSLGGGIPFIHVGRRVMYRADDVAAWIEAQPRRRSTSDTPCSTQPDALDAA